MNKKNLFYIISINIFCIFLILFIIFIYYKDINYYPNSSIETNFNYLKTTPNTTITFITNFSKCNHTEKNICNIPLKFVNMTKNEFISNYPDWKLISFSSENIKLIQTINEFCDKHFLVKSNNDGFISIYSINPNGSKTLKENTKIAIKFLSKSDKKELSIGKEIYGYNNLNGYIENFE